MTINMYLKLLENCLTRFMYMQTYVRKDEILWN